jgi:hypothetical protein
MPYEFVNPGSGLGQAQQCGSVKPIKGFPTFSLDLPIVWYTYNHTFSTYSYSLLITLSPKVIHIVWYTYTHYISTYSYSIFSIICMFCRSLFILLSFFFRPLYFLFFFIYYEINEA